MDVDPATLRAAAISFCIILGSLTLHEWGHAFAADRLGDDTPRRHGRVTLNPLAHLDWIGTVLFPLLGAFGLFGGVGVIGWAKPVPTTTANYRRRRIDPILVTFAGPLMNLVLAFVAVVIAAFMARAGAHGYLVFAEIVEINVKLIVLNLLPIPPLDGSKFLVHWLGMREATYARLSLFGGLMLLLLFYVPGFQRALDHAFQSSLVPFAWLIERIA